MSNTSFMPRFRTFHWSSGRVPNPLAGAGHADRDFPTAPDPPDRKSVAFSASGDHSRNRDFLPFHVNGENTFIIPPLIPAGWMGTADC